MVPTANVLLLRDARGGHVGAPIIRAGGMNVTQWVRNVAVLAGIGLAQRFNKQGGTRRSRCRSNDDPYRV